MSRLERIHDYLELNRRDPEYNRFFISYIFLFFALGFLAVFALIEIFLLDDRHWALILALLALICSGTIYYLFTTKDIGAASHLTTAILAVFLLTQGAMGQAHESTFMMAAIFPGVALFLLGHRRGALYVLLFFATFGLLFWWNMTVSVGPVSQVDVAINTILTPVIITLQLFFYEIARKGANDENARLVEYLEILSSKDGLTGLWNRRLSDGFLEQEIARSQRQGNRFSVAILDIDHFKKVNDAYGHAEGDTVLKEIAQEFRTIVRVQDKVGRWGGEEFIVICSDTGIEDAVALFNRIRARIEGHDFSNGVNVTVSIGVAEYRASDSPTTLAARADKALYHAKQHGRNRVCTYKQFIEGRV
ncbi:diguanylate cyclase (GGDEF) domain-containing protein [Salinihabitans flavidus]|uniref:diguanylate cyclase n=1 Tax=Salinihabitans flavidus TaxID=569882 RepID=A0A1H8RZ46_9RHOB|nr:GGDEF domain-containing protein [Salinihabitans flavidus]SEO71645.1 diguanylate cyclase (GGDEF) domain-containing protein [Salinihabitans flavidus]